MQGTDYYVDHSTISSHQGSQDPHSCQNPVLHFLWAQVLCLSFLVHYVSQDHGSWCIISKMHAH